METPMPSHELERVIRGADSAIAAEDFDTLLTYYTDDAVLVVRPGMTVTGKEQIRRAFVGIAEHFNHSLGVRQGDMAVLESGDTALVVMETII